MPINYFAGAYEQLKCERPPGTKVEDFIKYFEKTLRSRFGINLSALNLDSLSPKQWLNDNVLNYYLNLLILGLNKSCYLFNTFFLGQD